MSDLVGNPEDGFSHDKAHLFSLIFPEPDKQALQAKQRHYDQDEVRRYMQKQKSERIRQQKEDEKRHREIEEAKRKHLEELSSKQKQAAVSSALVGKREKSRGRGQDIQSKPVNSINDLPNHHSFHKDRARYMVSYYESSNLCTKK